MKKFGISAVVAAVTSLVLGATSAAAASTPCSKLSGALTAAGAGAASAKAIAAAAGFAVVEHSSQALILTSVGVGGTGYIGGTIGTATVATLGILSSPYVIATGAVLAVGAGGTYAYCKFVK
jgi:hypothetical protein